MIRNIIIILLFTIEVFSQPDIMWIKKPDSQDGFVKRIDKMLIDKDNNIIVLGCCLFDDQNVAGFFIAKLDTPGDQKWSKYFNGNTFVFYNKINDAVLDKNGNIYITSQSKHILEPYIDEEGNFYEFPSYSGSETYFVMKLNDEGEIQWMNNYEYGEGHSMFNNKLICNNNDIYVMSSNLPGPGSPGYNIIKHNENGLVLWTKKIDTHEFVEIHFILSDNENNFLIGGTKGLNHNEIIYHSLNKFNSSGDFIWESTLYGLDYPTSYGVIDFENNIFVSCETTDSSDKRTLTTVKYNSSGIEQWVNTYNVSTQWVYVTPDNTGGAYVATDSLSMNQPALIFKYNQQGKLEWSDYYEPPEAIFFTRDLKVFNNFIYVIGVNGKNIIMRKFNSEGKLIWLKKINKNLSPWWYESCNWDIDNNGSAVIITLDNEIIKLASD